MRCRVLPCAVAIERVAVGLQLLRQVFRGYRRAGLGRAPLDVIHRSGEQPDARRRHCLDHRVFADFDGGAVRELDLDAPGLGAQPIALDERHIADRRLAFTVPLEHGDAFDEARYAGAASWA